MRRLLIAALGLSLFLTSVPFAADHADAPNNAFDRATDLADIYAFLDPNDNSRVVLIMTFAGFIVPGENGNFGIFDPDARYTFGIENTGDARADDFIDVRFAPRVPPAAQVATITLPDGRSFSAPATIPSATAEASPTPMVTTDGGVSFFAGLADDPFFFDIPAFGRFVASVLSGNPNPAVFQRGRDSFAGYNVLSIALSMPASLLRGPAGNVIGVNASAQRRQEQRISRNGEIDGRGRWVNADREGVPAINVALIPFARKNEYNAANPPDDAAGQFANSIVGTLRALGTNDTNIGILANVAVLNGDYLRLDTAKGNTGPGGGDNAGAGFPNGRRLRDDVIDTILFFVANQNQLGDNVNSSDLPLRDTFPFLGGPHQPRQPGTIDDNTRN